MEKMNEKVWGVIGCGWLGKPLANSLVHAGKQVHGTTRSEEKLSELNELGIDAHILNERDMYQEQSWIKDIEVLVLNIPPSSFEDYPKAMASLCKQTNTSCKVLFISSTSVYPNLNKWVDENTPPSGQNRNGPIVESTEKMLQGLMHERLTIIRMAGLVGGERNPIRYIAGKEINGANAPVNLVHRDDCIGVIKEVIHKGYIGKTLNVCCSDHPTKKEYYKYAADLFNLPPPVFKEESNSYKFVDNTKSKKELNYSYHYDSPFDFPK